MSLPGKLFTAAHVNGASEPQTPINKASPTKAISHFTRNFVLINSLSGVPAYKVAQTENCPNSPGAVIQRTLTAGCFASCSLNFPDRAELLSSWCHLLYVGGEKSLAWREYHRLSFHIFKGIFHNYSPLLQPCVHRIVKIFHKFYTA